MRGTTQVKIGKEVVDKAGQAFEDISKLVEEITNQIQEIVNVSEVLSKIAKSLVTEISKFKL